MGAVQRSVEHCDHLSGPGGVLVRVSPVAAVLHRNGRIPVGAGHLVGAEHVQAVLADFGFRSGLHHLPVGVAIQGLHGSRNICGDDSRLGGRGRDLFCGFLRADRRAGVDLH